MCRARGKECVAARTLPPSHFTPTHPLPLPPPTAAAANAKFYQVYHAIPDDAAGKLYIVDGGNSLVRVADLATRNVTTLAGGGGPLANNPCYQAGNIDGVGTAALLSAMQSVAFDSTLLYLAQFGGGNGFFAIRTVNKATAVVGTLLGSDGTAGGSSELPGLGRRAYFGNPMGLFMDATGHLLIAANQQNCIYRVTLASLYVEPLVETRTSAQALVCRSVSSDGLPGFGPNTQLYSGLGSPYDVAEAPEGFYFSDTTYGTIRRVDAGYFNTRSTVTGSPTFSVGASPSKTPSPSNSASPTPSPTESPTPSGSPTASPTPSESPTPSDTPSFSPSSSGSPSQTPTVSPTPSETPSFSPTPSA